jgi:PAS domain S-box-containing protein
MKQKKGRLVFENKDLGMAIVSVEGFFQEVSFSFAGILGSEPSDLKGCNIKEIFTDSQDHEEQRVHDSCRELRLQSKDGHWVWVNLFSSTVFDSTGKPEYFVYYLQDISKNKKVVKDLTESQQLLQNAFDDMAFGMIIFNSQGKIVRINNFLCQLLGYNEEELKDKHFVDITHPDDIEISITSDRRLLAKEIKYTIYEKRYMHRDGTPIWVLISNSLMHDEKGQPYYFLAHVQDIRQRKLAERALIESENRFQHFMNHFPGKAFIKDMHGRYLYGNKHFWDSLDNQSYRELPELRDKDIYSDSCANQMGKNDQAVLVAGKAKEFIETISDGSEENYWLTFRFPIERENEITLLGGIALDVTTRTKAQQELQQRDLELEEQRKNLERVNTALKVVVEYREKEMIKKEEDTLAHLEKLVLPYLHLIRTSGLTSEQASYLDIALNNLVNFTDDFASRLSTPEALLSPTELQVADLLRHNKTSDEIARALNISTHTVSRHRASIRKKLGLTNTKVNLSSFLTSLPSQARNPK